MAANSKLIIEGIDEQGDTFRPSDWPERLASVGAEFGKDHRLHFSPSLHPDLIDGTKCVVVDTKLLESNPELDKLIREFIQINKLRSHVETS